MAYEDYGTPAIKGYDEPRSSFIGNLIGRRPVDTFAIATITVLGLGVIINAVAFQKAPHPAPMFAPAKSETAALLQPPQTPPSASTLTPADAITTATIAQGSKPPTMQSLTAKTSEIPANEEGFPPALDRNLVVNVQQELIRRGFLAGSADGAAGPKTESAVRQYQLAARLDPNGEVTDDLLVHLRKSTIRKALVTAAPVAPMTKPAAKDKPAATPQPQPRPRAAQVAVGEPLSVTPVRHGVETTASITPRPQSIARAVEPSVVEKPASGRGLGQLFSANEPQAQRPPVNKTMLSAERALSRAGYGPLKVDGIYDAETRKAIASFERANNMPITGQLSATLIKALARTTGESFN